jgi:hypothetical protein
MKVKQKIITILVVAVISSCITVIEPRHSLNPQRISTEALLKASPLASGIELPELSHIDGKGREGYPQHAEAANLNALEVDSSNLVAMNNLAGLYEQQDRSELAAQYQLRIESHRMRNMSNYSIFPKKFTWE